MTILEALQSLNQYPISDNIVEKIGVERSLTTSLEYTATIFASSAFQLASADIYLYLAIAPNIVEQEVGITQAPTVRTQFRAMANAIYLEYSDDKYSGLSYGFKGENYG